MERPVSKIKLISYDDLFKTDENRAEEKIVRVPLDDLHSFTCQYGTNPYQVRDDEDMAELAESIKRIGVQEPAIVRPRAEGGFEIISGHRRKHGSELAGLNDMPVIVRNYSDDEAIIIIVDSNLKRENVLPSEKAFAYKMKLDAIKRQAGRPKDNSRQFVGNLESADIVGMGTGESGRQVQRYIRLTELIDPILEMVDKGEIAFNAAVEVSYLSAEQQVDLIDIIEKEQCPPSISQAQKMKKLSAENKLTYDVMDVIMSEQKEPPIKIVLKEDKLRKYFPQSYSAAQIEQKIFKILDSWYKKQLEQQQQR